LGSAQGIIDWETLLCVLLYVYNKYYVQIQMMIGVKGLRNHVTSEMEMFVMRFVDRTKVFFMSAATVDEMFGF